MTFSWIDFALILIMNHLTCPSSLSYILFFNVNLDSSSHFYCWEVRELVYLSCFLAYLNLEIVLLAFEFLNSL